MTEPVKTLKEFKADLLQLEKQSIAVNGAMEYVGRQIFALEQKKKNKKNQKEEMKK